MKRHRFFILFLVVFIGFSSAFAQSSDTSVLRFDEYLGLVKKYHPIVKQAELIIEEGQAKLMKARGSFDPKIEIDYDRKKFKNTEYYDKLNAAFKIPTWYGIELKANFEEADGIFLNPENNLPDDGLYSVGVSFSVAQGFLINERMASLEQAKIFREQAKVDRDVLVNSILYDASLAYFNWLQAYNETIVLEDFLINAQDRFKGVKRNVEVGEVAAIDSIEARITVTDRKLNLEKSRLELLKTKLELSNFLWLENNIPVELQDSIIPDVMSMLVVDATLNIDNLRTIDFQVDSHPKLQSLNYKLESLNIDRRLKANMLLPKVDLQYNFLSEDPDLQGSFSTAAYKSGVNFRFPLFLRKERGDLRLAKVKIQDTEYDIASERIKLKNKVTAIKQELESYLIQNNFVVDILSDYEKMLTAEERKFTSGESSLFLVNTRESKLIDAQLKGIELQNKYLSTKARLFNIFSLNPDF